MGNCWGGRSDPSRLQSQKSLTEKELKEQEDTEKAQAPQNGGAGSAREPQALSRQSTDGLAATPAAQPPGTPRRQSSENPGGPAHPPDDQGAAGIPIRAFKFKELQAATQKFREDLVLGEGGFGKVYKGWLPPDSSRPGQPPLSVAVKKLNPGSFQGLQELLAEILVLGKLRHPNLVVLIGYCAEQKEALLVYEFLSNGSLDYHLYPRAEGVPPLSWQYRLRIALDSARGLAYLHANNIIHRDFKAPNILLDENFNGRLTDFGLAKDGPVGDKTHVSTAIMGTLGYLDPRYAETGQLTQKSDVYAFGVMVLELLTGRRAMDHSNPAKPMPLTAWVRPHLAKRRPDVGLLMDPHLAHEPFPEKVARTLAISARHCIQEDIQIRPSMQNMVDTLEPLLEIPSVAAEVSNSMELPLDRTVPPSPSI